MTLKELQGGRRLLLKKKKKMAELEAIFDASIKAKDVANAAYNAAAKEFGAARSECLEIEEKLMEQAREYLTVLGPEEDLQNELEGL